MEQYGCVLLKGGKSSRMGGSDKAKLLYRGKSFEERIKGELEQLGLPVFVSEAKKSPDPRAIPDLIPEAGPLGGIYSCLKQTGLDGLFFVSCDMPLFASYLGKRALMEAGDKWDAVIWKTRDGRIHPVCGWYSARCLPVLEKQLLEKNGKVRDLLGKLQVKVLETENEHVPDRWFLNVNTPQALGELTCLKTPVFAVSGKKNTGKTTLTETLVREFSVRGLRVAVIKHDSHDFVPDVPGTDSYRHKAAGAVGTLVYSENRFCLVKEEKGHEAEDFFIVLNILLESKGILFGHPAAQNIEGIGISVCAGSQFTDVKASGAGFKSGFCGNDRRAAVFEEFPVGCFVGIETCVDLTMSAVQLFESFCGGSMVFIRNKDPLEMHG